MADDDDATGLCKICDKKSFRPLDKGENCHACRQFFRRSVAERKEYKCHWEARCRALILCRSCRFDRCLLAGLEARLVWVEQRAESDRRYFGMLDARTGLLRKRQGIVQQEGTHNGGADQMAQSIQQQQVMADNTSGDEAMDQSQREIETGVQKAHSTSTTTTAMLTTTSAGSGQSEQREVVRVPFASERLHFQKAFEMSKCIHDLGAFEAQLEQLHNGKDLRLNHGLLDQFGTLVELLHCRTFNVLADTDKVTLPLPVLPVDWLCNNAAHERLNKKYVKELGLLEIVCTVELVQRMPFFTRLDKADQICLLNYVGMALTLLDEAYYTSRSNAPFAQRASGFSGYLLLQHGLFAPVIKSFGERLFVDTLAKIRRLRLEKETFLLARALIAMHASSTGLSRSAQLVVQEEAERTAGMLMHYLQCVEGPMEGARRFAELIQLIECAFHNAQRHRECVTFMVSLYPAHYDWIRDSIPPLFAQMYWHGGASNGDAGNGHN